MSRSQLKFWPVVNCLDEEFMAKIKMVLVYGQYADKALMVLKDDSVYEVGTNVVEVSGSGNKRFNSLWKPTKVDELSDKGVKDFVWGREYGVAALTDQGEVYYWKQKESEAQCSREKARPTLIGESFYGKSIVQISCSDSHLFALTDDGKMFRHNGCQTEDSLQKLYQNRPLQGPVKYIACGSSHVSIVDTYGGLHICVTRSCVMFGQVLISTDGYISMSSPLKIVFVKVACGSSHTLALSEDGDVYAWGKDSRWEMDSGTTNTTAIKVINSTIMGKVADIGAISTDHISAVLTCTGQVFAWGPCRGLTVVSPTLTHFTTFHEVFGAYARPNVMHSPLILRDEENEEEETDIIDSLRQAFDNPSHSDFAIKVEGKPIHVHKSVLKIRSVYFQSMFKEQWTENNQSTFEHNDFPYDVYESFLKYLYTDEIDVQEEKLIELLALANAYCELQLKRRCAQILGKGIQLSNVLRLYDIAVTHGSTELEDFCMKFASNHMPVIVQSPQFATLNAERAKAFMIKAVAKGAFY